MASMMRRTNRAPSLFGSLVLRYRAAAGMTQEHLAARAGLSPDAIAALERGKRQTPRAATVALLADALALDEHARARLEAAAQASGASRRALPTATVAQDSESLAWSAPRHPWWLAAEPTPLVGRTEELDTIVRVLVDGDIRLLTLVGPAGVGKTRLALAAAARLTTARADEGRSRFPDGVALVDLTPIRDPVLVPEAVARGLGLLDVGGRPALERLTEALGQRRQVLVVDNFEHVLPAASAFATLLAACPGLALLVTSRVPLQLRWEQTLRIAPLPVPDLAVPLPPLAELGAIPSVELFVGRARAHSANFALGERQAPLVAQLAAHLDGLPLALELAAARLDVLPLPALAQRLDDRLGLLAWQARDRPERQQSLEAAVGWSFELLSTEEQRIFRHLGVFIGHASVESLAAVLGDKDLDHALEGLVSLAEKSLILRKHDDDDDGRVERGLGEVTFGMLETVREYAQERLAAEGELAAARRAHAYYFLTLAERADPQLRGHDQRMWYLRLERKHDNLRAALRWLLDQDDLAERESALRLAGALGWFWSAIGYHAEGVRWVDKALARAPRSPEDSAGSVTRMRALIGAGELLAYQGQGVRARPVLEEALELARQQHDTTGIAQALSYLGAGALFIGEVEEAVSLLHEALVHARGLIDPHPCGIALFVLGLAASAQGDDVSAAVHYVEALSRLEAAGDERIAAHVRFNLGVIVGQQGDLPRAVALVRAGLDASMALRNRFLLLTGVRAALMLSGERGDPARGAQLLGATDALTQATGATLGAAERVAADRIEAWLRERLAQEEMAAAYREGRALSVKAMAEVALTMLDDADSPPTLAETTARAPSMLAYRSSEGVVSSAGSLSEREQEVLRLVAQGLSSKAIAQQLFLSPSTINQHIKSIFNKLGADTRAQAVAVAARRGVL